MRTEMTPLVLSYQEADDILEHLVDNFFNEVPSDDDLYVPSLYELYDLDVESAGEDNNEQAVNEFFPESLILAASEGLFLPEPPVLSPVCEPIGGECMPQLHPEDMDLLCYEVGFPCSDSEDEQDENGMAHVSASAAAAAADREREEFQLDHPELPGHNCKSCEHHRNSTGNTDLMCSLCYLRAYNMFIYSPVSDNEPEPNSTLDGDERPSPPKLRSAVPEGVIKPVPQRVTGRRSAVESILDLIQEEEREQTVPVDLSVKRPRCN
ncbi:control protein E1A [Human adenovirus 12]|nr:control protein E1A [Human adenovirus 12]WOZ23696.1 control protein E1A [Human adenovirus 12]WOZ24600.1 control protein E1A [Human adenovirus 12]